MLPSGLSELRNKLRIMKVASGRLNQNQDRLLKELDVLDGILTRRDEVFFSETTVATRILEVSGPSSGCPCCGR